MPESRQVVVVPPLRALFPLVQSEPSALTCSEGHRKGYQEQLERTMRLIYFAAFLPWATDPAGAQTKFNPYTGQWQLAPPNAVPQYNPYRRAGCATAESDRCS